MFDSVINDVLCVALGIILGLMCGYLYKTRRMIVTIGDDDCRQEQVSAKSVDYIEIFSDDVCVRGQCQAASLTDCVSDYCHGHCPTKCKCGAGDIAQKLIVDYGSLATAERTLNSKLDELAELPEWRENQQ